MFSQVSVCPQGWDLSGRPSPWTVMCGWYASYWNAFLFYGQLANNFIFTASSSSTILWPISVQHPYFMVSSSNTFIMAISSSTYILGSVHPKPFYDQLVQHNITANWPPTLFYSQFVNTSILRVVCQQ